MSKKKLLIFIISLVFLFISCNEKNEKKVTENSKKEIVIGVTSFADTLEPTEQYFSWVITRYGIGENLVSFDKNGEIKPLLAEEWKISEDKLTWEFKIRDNVKFSNGNPLTAEAVKKSLERTFEKSPRAKSFFNPKNIEADGQILKISTEKPEAILPECLADPLFLIVDTSVNTEEFSSKGPICTGPYKVEKFVPEEGCTVIKNENYWGTKSNIEKVVFKNINDQSTRSLALKAGEIDIAYNLKSENKADFEGNSNIIVQEIKSLRSTHVFLNQNGILKDKNLRQAILRALNKEIYANKLLGGAATPGKAPIPPTLDYGFDSLIDENKYNVSSAKDILKNSGYVDIDGDGFVESPDGKKIDLEFVIYTSRSELNVYAQAMQSDLKEIGIKVTIKPVSYETLLDIRDSGKFDLIIWNVLAANTGDPEKYLRESWYSKSPSNKWAYKNKNVDDLLDELSKTFDKDKRKNLAIKIEQEIMNDAATAFLGYETTFLFSNKKIKGATLYPMDYYWLTKDVELAD